MDGSRIFRISLLAAVVLILSGCESTRLADNSMDSTAVARNEVRVAVRNHVKAVNNAVKQVCADLDLKRLSQNEDLLQSDYTFRSQTDGLILISTCATSAISTEVRIQYDHNSDPHNPDMIAYALKQHEMENLIVPFTGSTPIVGN